MDSLNILVKTQLDTKQSSTDIKNKIKQIEKQLESIKLDTKIDPKALNQLQSNFSDISKQTKIIEQNINKMSSQMNKFRDSSEKSSQSLISTIKKFSQWLFIGTLVMQPIHMIQEGMTTIYELDKSLTDLKKVSDELGTTVGFKDFTLQANQMAIDVGHSTKSAIDSIAEFKRLGYSLTESQQLAKQALIYSNIGDVDIADSTKSIISTLKGFNLEANDTLHVMDALNEVGNNFAVSSAGLGSALQRSSSALYEANNSLEESIGLITAGNASIQNPEKVGNGLKTVAMRLRGISEEAGETAPKLDGLIKSLTGVDIMESADKFKSTYQIMKEISEVWDTISDKDQAVLLEKMFGKHQGAVGASILNNMADGAKAYETAMNSAGSATKEQEAYITSLEAKINKFNETVNAQWVNATNTDAIKGLVDGATELIAVYGNLDSITLGLIATFLMFKGSALSFALATKLQLIPTVVTASASVNTLSASFLKLGTSIKTAFMSNPLGWIALGASIVLPILTELNKGFEKQKEKVENLSTELQNLNSEYEQLRNKDNLTTSESQRLNLLEAQIKANEIILQQEQKKLYTKYQTERGSTKNPIDRELATYRSLENKSESLKDKMLGLGEVTDKNAQSFENLNDKQNEVLGKQSDLIANFVKETTELQNFKDMGVKLSEEDEKRLVQLNEIINAYNNSEEAITACSNAVGNASDIAINASESYSVMRDAVDEYVDTLKTVEDVEDKVKKGYSLSYEEMTKLKDTYPQLESSIKRTASGWTIEVSALNAVKNTAKETALAQVQAEKEKTLAVLNGSKSRIGIIINEATTQRDFIDAILGKNTRRGSSQGIVLSDEEQNLMNQFNQLQTFLRQEKAIRKEIDELSKGSIGGSSSKPKSSKPSAISHVDETQAIVDTINKQVILDNIQNKYLETQIKIAENAEDYVKQIELQNKLLGNQQKTVSDLKLANDQIHAQAEMVRSSTKYNTESWFNADNSDTVAYINLLNTFEGKTDNASKKAVESIKTIHDKLKTLKDGWISNKDAIDSMNLSIKSTADSVKDLSRKALETIADMEKQIVKMWEDEYEEKIKDLKEYYDEKKELADEDYNREKKRLDEELDNFKKYIEEQKDLLNDSYDEDRFNEELTEKQNELAKLQAQFNELSLSASSGDRVALAKQKDLAETIADKQKEIDRLIAERSKKLQEDALDDSLSDYEDFINNKQDILDEEHDAEIRQIERTYQKKLEKLKEEYSKQELYSKAREMLISGEYNTLTALYEEYQKKQGEGWSSLGSILESEYLAKLREASALLAELEAGGISKGHIYDALNGKDSNSSSSSNSDKIHADSNGNAPSGTKIGDIVYTAGNHAFKVVGYGDTTKTTGGQYNPASNLTSIKLYDTGGEFKSGTGGINLSGKPEYILNPEQTEYLKVFLTKVPDMFSLSNLNNSNLLNNNIPTKETIVNQISVDNLVNFEGGTGGLSIQDVERVVDKSFNNFAKKLNSGNINFNKGNALI